MTTDALLRSFTPADGDRLRARLVLNSTGLIFRRVVNVVGMHLTQVYRHHASQSTPGVPVVRTEIGVEDYEDFDFDYTERLIETRYTEVYVGTGVKPMRKCDRYGGASFNLTHETCAELDIFSSTCFKARGVVDSRGDRGYEVPEAGGLVVIRLGMNSTRADPVIGSWAPCSEQFLHLWTYLHYNNHHAFHKGAGRGADTSRGLGERSHNKAMCRTTLGLNTLRRLVLAYTCAAKPLPHFTNKVPVAVERHAKEYCHTYNCIYLMAVSGILPTQKNIPTRSTSSGPVLKTWDLSPYFAQYLIHYARA